MSVTLKDIAKRADVSIATVSKVLNNKSENLSPATIERVKEIAEDMQYIPNMTARSMKTNMTKTIGLIIPDIRNPFFTELARGVTDRCDHYGYSVFLCNSDDDIDKELMYLVTMSARQIDGFIIAGSSNREKQSSCYLQKPVVSVDRKTNYKSEVSYIYMNNKKSSYQIVDEVLKTDKRPIIYLAGPKCNAISKDRYFGAYEAARKNDVSISVYFGDFSYDFGYSFLKEFPDPQHKLIVCGNDIIALGAIAALKERAFVIPNDVSVIGFDDIEISKDISPALTTVCQPTYDMGTVSVDSLINCLNKREFEKNVVMEPQIKIRDTTRI